MWIFNTGILERVKQCLKGGQTVSKAHYAVSYILGAFFLKGSSRPPLLEGEQEGKQLIRLVRAKAPRMVAALSALFQREIYRISE